LQLMTDQVLLIGNGINNIRQDYKWSDLISNLIDFIGATGQISLDGKPFPLLYEEIYVEAVKNRNFREIEIKEFIAREIQHLEPNEIHQEIIGMGLPNLITTNYDFTMESVLELQTASLVNCGAVRETVFSVFRHHCVNQTKFWHIHGDANQPSSITLGYEQYSGYLQQMRNYVVTGTGAAYKEKFDPLTKRLKGNIRENYSWLDFFFTKDIYIIGLTLDFIEIHLWWLLTFRQRAKLTRVFPVNNKIVYFYPSTIATQIKSKIDLLKSSGIIPYSINPRSDDRRKFYTDILKKIKRGI
jgi:hypothetical protein